jgi:hypothetical protein
MFLRPYEMNAPRSTVEPNKNNNLNRYWEPHQSGPPGWGNRR